MKIKIKHTHDRFFFMLIPLVLDINYIIVQEVMKAHLL